MLDRITRPLQETEKSSLPSHESFPVLRPSEVRMDEVQSDIYRISGFVKEAGITFNQFLIKGEEKSALIHTGPVGMFQGVEQRVREVIKPEQLYYVVFLHFESDEWGGMRFLEYPNAKLVCSRLSSVLNLRGWYDVPKEHIPVWENDSISLGSRKKLGFLMTPHVHHWDSMMAFEQSEKALFPSDLFLQPGQNGSVTNDRELVSGMIEQYKMTGIFASERPVRDILPKLERLSPRMINAMHGASLDSSVHPDFFKALRTENYAYTNKLLFEELPVQ